MTVGSEVPERARVEAHERLTLAWKGAATERALLALARYRQVACGELFHQAWVHIIPKMVSRIRRNAQQSPLHSFWFIGNKPL